MKTEILDVINDINEQLKKLYYLTQKDGVNIKDSFDILHYTVNQKLLPEVENHYMRKA